MVVDKKLSPQEQFHQDLHKCLSSAIESEQPQSVIEALVSACPAHVLEMSDERGSKPVHLAFEYGASEEIVRLLVEKSPRAFATQSFDFKDKTSSKSDTGTHATSSACSSTGDEEKEESSAGSTVAAAKSNQNHHFAFTVFSAFGK